MQHGDDTSWPIRVLHALNRIYVRGYHEVQVSGQTRVPRHGPVILISNHISSLDPLVIQAVVDRPIAWMIAREYYQTPGLEWLFKTIHLIPVSRDGKDSSALRSALRWLHAGRVLGVFPEGKISTTGRILPFQTGIAMIASRSGAPVTPIYQTGTTHQPVTMVGAILQPQRIRVHFGKKVELSKNISGAPEPDIGLKSLEIPISELHARLYRKTF